LVILAARSSLSGIALATGVDSTGRSESMVALIIASAKAANKKMPEPTITARLRSEDLRAADRGRAGAERDGAADAIAAFLPADDLTAMPCALHKQSHTLPSVGKFFVAT
jgi:hypothetical protein